MSLTSYQAAPPRDPEEVNIPVVLALARGFCEKLLLPNGRCYALQLAPKSKTVSA
jgi:hypothetical protein